MTGLAFLASLCLSILPNISKTEADTKPLTIKERALKMKKIGSDPAFVKIIPYFFYTGLVVAIYNTFET